MNSLETVRKLREQYPALQVRPVAGSTFARRHGDGLRVVFLVHCDGRVVKYAATTGQFFEVKRNTLELVAVLDRKGKKIRHQLDRDTGYILLYRGDEDGSEVWEELTPWLKYDQKWANAIPDNEPFTPPFDELR